MANDEFFDLSQVRVRRSMALLALGALVGLAIAGYGLFTAKGTRSRSVPPEAVALINQRPILRSDFMAQAEAQFVMPYGDITPAQRQQTLEDMIAEELRVQRGMEIDLPSYDPDVRAALVAGVELEVSADVLSQQPDDAKLRAYYEEHRGKYSSEGVFRLRDLLVPPAERGGPAATLKNANAVAKALRSGEPLFSVMKRFNLKDSDRFMSGGKVDVEDIFEFAVKVKLGDKLFAGVEPLKAGEVSEPIEDTDGLHVIQVVLHRRPVPQGFEAAADAVWTDYQADAQARVNKGSLDFLRRRADILLAPEFATGTSPGTSR